jgi:hypothetical protein
VRLENSSVKNLKVVKPAESPGPAEPEIDAGLLQLVLGAMDSRLKDIDERLAEVEARVRTLTAQRPE